MQVTLSIFVTTAIVVGLAIAVLVARRFLLPTGDVSLLINGSRTLRISVGEKLLWTLSKHNVYLPAACGGRGSCGQCRVVILSGAGEPLITERDVLSGHEISENVRLGCMVTVREDLSIQLPETVLNVKRWPCRVRSNRCVSTFMTELTLELDAAESFEFESGSYVLLEAPPGHTHFSQFAIDEQYQSEWQSNRLFNYESVRETPTTRAYSIASHPQEKNIVTLLIRIALPSPGAADGTPPGQVSSYAFGLRPGDSVSISGPYGEFRAQNTDQDMVFIGGGAGIAPLRSIIFDQLVNKQTSRNIDFYYGARSLRDVCYQREFEELASQHDNFEWHVALSEKKPEDTWSGATGFIHNLVYRHYLESNPQPESADYYVCGPPLMSNAVLTMLEDVGIDADHIFYDDFGEHI